MFRAKRADRIKLVFWNGTGLCLFAKRLEDGIFRWPKIEDGVMRLSAAQLSALLEGLDWRLVHEARETPARTQPGLLLAVLRRSESGVSDASPDGDE
ncbi:IS66 family insertion sequence element accessory protein TnpB [Bradyrhizobium zhanjiangense]|uniref:IS66 family insertion sequence element accessory protein TnpB n=1 Tax=Bradyrhizobium zhanjiangense TaxID=1325107 RepID=UPI0013E8C444|nr:IS66 family insertion sequence element accessory protein TnpB [Bradyrhizobium zhanjiangense]